MSHVSKDSKPTQEVTSTIDDDDDDDDRKFQSRSLCLQTVLRRVTGASLSHLGLEKIWKGLGLSSRPRTSKFRLQAHFQL